jgi:hypothetical protein
MRDREEMEALSWKLISGVPAQRMSVAESMKNDPSFAAYRLASLLSLLPSI